MNMKFLVGPLPQSLLAVVILGGGLAACTTQEVNPDGGGGTTGGAGITGTAGTGGGTGGGYELSDGVPCLPVTAALITDFTYEPDGGAMDEVSFGDYTTSLSGGQFIYPSGAEMYPLASDVTGNNWHITGTVGNYSGFGLYFNNSTTACNRIDASAYRGISFTISGTVQGGSVTLSVETLKNAIPPSWLNTHGGNAMATDPGHCVPNAAATNQYAQTDCVQPTKPILVTATPTPQTVLWSDFTTGKPLPAPNGMELTGIRWFLPNPPGVGTTSVTTYSVDLVVDDLKFVP